MYTCTHVCISKYIHMYTYHEINTSGESSLLDRPHLHIWIHIHVCVRIHVTYVYIPRNRYEGRVRTAESLHECIHIHVCVSIYMYMYIPRNQYERTGLRCWIVT